MPALVNLHDYFYRDVRFSISLEAGEFDKDSFLADTQPEKKTGQYRFVCSSKEHKDKQHAHVNVEFLPDNEVSVEVSYAISAARASKYEPSMEDCARWISRYFRIKKVIALVEADFRFDKHYIPILPMPFPLMVNNETLTGCSITGVAIEFPEDADLSKAIIQVWDDGTTDVTAWGLMLLATHRFDLNAAMKKFAKYGRKLIRKVAIAHERKTDR